MKKAIAFMIVAILISSSVGGTYWYIHKNNEVKTNAYNYEDIEAPQEKVTDKDIETESIIAESELIRTDSQNGIDVAVVFNNILEEDEENLVFKLMLNNHTVNLDNIDFAELASVKTDNGAIVEDNISWELSGGGGHHVTGFLRIPKLYSGKAILDDTTEFIELEIKNLGEVESRTFRWDADALELYN